LYLISEMGDLNGSLTTDRKCKKCGEIKKRTEFYSTSGFTCKECKKRSDGNNAKTNKNTVITFLTEILESQKKTECMLRERMDDMESEITKLRKQVKKLAVA
jgi:hypothetical protein